jgi:hypothetical protein
VVAVEFGCDVNYGHGLREFEKFSCHNHKQSLINC